MKCTRVVATLFGAVLFSAAAQPVVHIAGVVRDESGGTLPGATVTVTRDGSTRGQAVTDENGRFEFGGLLAGTYSVTANLVGFRPQTKDVRLTDVSTAPLEFDLRHGVLSEVLWIKPEPREAHRRADAIAHIRIEATVPPGACGAAGLVSASHRTSVVAVWKGVLPAIIQLIQEAAGVCFDGSVEVRGIEKTYQPGDDYVIFLEGAGERFGRLVGPHFSFRVHEGRVQNPNAFAGLPHSITLAEFRTALEQLPR